MNEIDEENRKENADIEDFINPVEYQKVFLSRGSSILLQQLVKMLVQLSYG